MRVGLHVYVAIVFVIAVLLFSPLPAHSMSCSKGLSNNSFDLVAAILGLTEEAVELLGSHNIQMHERYCPVISATLRNLIWNRFRVEAELVSNSAHIFLRVQDYFGPSQHLYIDGGYQLFIPEENRDHRKIIVGSEEQILVAMSKAGASSLDRWFKLRPYPEAAPTSVIGRDP